MNSKVPYLISCKVINTTWPPEDWTELQMRFSDNHGRIMMIKTKHMPAIYPIINRATAEIVTEKQIENIIDLVVELDRL